MKEIARTRRYGHPLSVIVFAIDEFQKLVERYGEADGQAVFKEVASVVGEQIRHPDFLFKMDGPEFLLLLPETDLTKAHMIGSRLQAIVHGTEFSVNGESVAITTSAGAATYLFVEVNLDVLISHAREVLAKAQKMGHNTILIYEE